jgi:RES domain-containing protein
MQADNARLTKACCSPAKHPLLEGAPLPAPKIHRVVRIEIPADVKIEPLLQEELPGWGVEDAVASRTYGHEWIRSRRTAVLRIPSLITLGREYNLVLNTEHPDFNMIRAGAPEIVHWDARLFQR